MSIQFSSMIWDYIIFFLFIIASTLYPLWDDIRGRKETQTKANYVFATGRVSMFAVMLSIARGSLGVRTFIGYPSELFYRGTGMWETLYGLLNAYPMVCLIFVPVYFNLGITSVYQYLDLRFKSRLVRCLASGSFVIRNMLSMGITIYTPCVALNTVVGVPYWASLITMTLISILFTLLGGLKAAITADVIQGVTIVLVSILVIFQGILESGGIGNVYQINKDNDRLQFMKFTGDLSTRVDTLSAYMGQLFISLSILGCQQNLVQRYLSMKSEKEVQKTLYANIPFISILFSLSWIVGLVVYSTYSQCDPLEAGYTKKYDEILPFFVLDKLLYIPGCLGIFMATLFNGALCLNVSNLNSLATVTWEDFLSQLPRFRSMVDKNQLAIIKFIGMFYAFIIMGIAFSVGLLSGVIETAMLTSSATSGPLVGVFLLAVLVPIANWKGAAVGMITSHIVTLVLIFGSFSIDKPSTEVLATSTEGCTNTTFSPWIEKSETTWLTQTSPVEIGWSNGENSFLLSTESPVIEKTVVQAIFGLTYMYYSVLGTIITMSVGVLVSWLTTKGVERCEDKLLSPYIVKLRNFCENRKSSKGNNLAEQHINHAFEISADAHQEKSSISTISRRSTINSTSINDTDGSDNIINIDEMTTDTQIRLEPTETYRKIIE